KPSNTSFFFTNASAIVLPPRVLFTLPRLRVQTLARRYELRAGQLTNNKRPFLLYDSLQVSLALTHEADVK
nr:hypothetical protein [Streptococcus mitis]